MPTLQFAVPARQCIIDKDENSISLIGLLEGFQIQSTSNDVEVTDSVIPVPWAFVTLWFRDEADEEKTFEQRIALIGPSGKVLAEMATLFHMEIPNHRITIKFEGFPVEKPGHHVMQVFIRDAEHDQPWQLVKEYALHITQITVPIVS